MVMETAQAAEASASPQPLTEAAQSSFAPSSSSSKVELLGSPDTGMVLVYPPSPSSDGEGKVPGILRQLSRLLQDRRVKKELMQWIKQKVDNSARHIQGGRVEIFLDAAQAKKTSAAFDVIFAGRLPVGAKDQILDFARQQAQKDPRVQQQQGEDDAGLYEFGNFSLICSFEPCCHAQAPHIDLIHPNYQFGLIVSEGTSGTLFFDSGAGHVNTVDALVAQWKVMPPALVEALRNDEAAKMLLACFGDVLLPERDVLGQMKSKPKLPTGSLLSLPGSVIHAGPASVTSRAVLFFSGWPKDSKAAPYDPDVQYTGVMLVGHLANLLWRSKGDGFPERHYLLQRLAEYIEHSTGRGMWGHFGPGELGNFVGNIEENAFKKHVSRDEYINRMAQSPTMGTPGDPFSDPDCIDIRQLEQISVDHLHTIWDGTECHVFVYRRIQDGKVILRYPTEGTHNPDEYEGHRSNDNFRLTMNGPDKQVQFDGSNGKLVDSEGEEVKMHTKQFSQYKGQRVKSLMIISAGK